jgi:hypothetical protein
MQCPQKLTVTQLVNKISTIVEPEGILPNLNHNIDPALFYIEWLLVITEHTDDEPPLVGCSRQPIQDSVFRVTLHA